MTPAEFKAARERLGLTQEQLAQLLGLRDSRTVRRWEADPATRGARSPDPTACRVLRWMTAPGRPDDWPTPPSA